MHTQVHRIIMKLEALMLNREDIVIRFVSTRNGSFVGLIVLLKYQQSEYEKSHVTYLESGLI